MKYRLSWETVSAARMGAYSNADPMYYSNTTQIVPNSEIPDDDWHPVTREGTGDILDQHRQLQQWDQSGWGFVRNVVLEQTTDTPTWTRVT